MKNNPYLIPLLLITLACLTLLGCVDQEWKMFALKADSNIIKGDYEQAMKYAVKSRDFAANKLGTDSPFYATSLCHIGRVHLNQNELEQAEALFHQAIDLLGKSENPNGVEMADARANLARAYLLQKRYDEAIELYTFAIPVKIRHYGRNSISVAHDRYNFAVACRHKKLYPKAMVNLDRCQIVFMGYYGSNSGQLADAYTEMGTVMLNANNPAKAIGFIEKALEIYRKHFDETHKRTLKASHKLILAYHKLRYYDKAHQLAKQLTKDLETAHGPTSPLVVKSINLHANLYLNENKWDKALGQYNKALDILDKHYSVDFDPWLTTLNGLAYIHLVNKQYDKAESYYQQALQVSLNMEPANYNHQADSYYHLAFLYTLRQQYGKAQPLFQQLQAIQPKLPDTRKPIAERIPMDLATILIKQGEYDMAETHCIRIIENMQNKYDKNHIVTTSWKQSLADIYLMQKRFDEAESIYKQVLENYRQQIGENSYHVQRTLYVLKQLYIETKKPKKARHCEEQIQKIEAEIRNSARQ